MIAVSVSYRYSCNILAYIGLSMQPGAVLLNTTHNIYLLTELKKGAYLTEFDGLWYILVRLKVLICLEYGA